MENSSQKNGLQRPPKFKVASDYLPKKYQRIFDQPLTPIERALKEHQDAAGYVAPAAARLMPGPQQNIAIGAIIGELDWGAELSILNDIDREEERLP